MPRFILGWKVLGHERRLGARVVAYADDLVICCRGTGRESLAILQHMMQQLKLTVNEARTRLCRVPDESVDFLGYTIGRCYSPETGRAYIGTCPSRKSVQRVCRTVSELTCRRWLLLSVEDRVSRINGLLRGWSNYFRLGPVSKAYRSVDHHASRRLRQCLRAKHKVRGEGTSRFPNEYLYGELGLIQLQQRTRDFPWANASLLVRKPDAGIPHVRFDERGVETEHGAASEAPATERAGNRWDAPKPPRHTSTLLGSPRLPLLCHGRRCPPDETPITSHEADPDLPSRRPEKRTPGERKA